MKAVKWASTKWLVPATELCNIPPSVPGHPVQLMQQLLPKCNGCMLPVETQEGCRWCHLAYTNQWHNLMIEALSLCTLGTLSLINPSRAQYQLPLCNDFHLVWESWETALNTILIIHRGAKIILRSNSFNSRPCDSMIISCWTSLFFFPRVLIRTWQQDDNVSLNLHNLHCGVLFIVHSLCVSYSKDYKAGCFELQACDSSPCLDSANFCVCQNLAVLPV